MGHIVITQADPGKSLEEFFKSLHSVLTLVHIFQLSNFTSRAQSLGPKVEFSPSYSLLRVRTNLFDNLLVVVRIQALKSRDEGPESSHFA